MAEQAARKCRTLEERFWEKVDTSGGPDACWPWTASTAGGYGRIRISKDSTAKTGAHRVAYEIQVGPIPEEHDVLHNCPAGDNSLCCNGRHLWTGTHRENMEDCSRKGRARNRPNPRRGERSHLATLTELQVRAIRDLADAAMDLRVIAHAAGISEMSVQKIVQGRTWAHVARCPDQDRYRTPA